MAVNEKQYFQHDEVVELNNEALIGIGNELFYFILPTQEYPESFITKLQS